MFKKIAFLGLTVLMLVGLFSSVKAASAELDQSNSNATGAGTLTITNSSAVYCQSFIPTKSKFSYPEMQFSGNISNQTLKVDLKNDSGSRPGTTVGTYTATASGAGWLRFSGGETDVTTNNTYWLCLSYTGSSSYADLSVNKAAGNAYPNGILMFSYTGINDVTNDPSGSDIYFKTYGYTSATTDSTATTPDGTTSTPTSSTNVAKTATTVATPTAEKPVIASTVIVGSGVETPITKQITVKNQEKFTIKGKTLLPNVKIKLIIHSKDFTTEISSDQNSNWTYEVDPNKLGLEVGSHTITAGIIDTASAKEPQMQEVASFNYEAKISVANNILGNTNSNLIVILSVVFAFLVLGAIVVIYIKQRKNK